MKPEVLVCLRASAAQALLGRNFRVTRDRGTFINSSLAAFVMATTHPAAILRAPDSESREQRRREFAGDLKKLADLIQRRRPATA